MPFGGAGKTQRYFAFYLDRLSNRLFDASEIAAVEVAAGSVEQRSASTAMQYRIEEKSTKANYIKKPELNAFSAIALMMCRPRNRPNGILL